MIKKALCIACAVIVSGSVFAASNNTVTGQFMTASNVPLAAQQSLLKQTFQVRFPESVISVGDSMKYLLQTTGFSLVQDKAAYPFAYQMMQRPLPGSDRDFGPMTVKSGLQTLAGNNFQLIIDPVHRLISYRLKPSLAAIYENQGE